MDKKTQATEMFFFFPKPNNFWHRKLFWFVLLFDPKLELMSIFSPRLKLGTFLIIGTLACMILFFYFCRTLKKLNYQSWIYKGIN